MNDRVQPQIPIFDRWEFELACVREFSHSGAQVGPTVSREQRRERIRLAILREDKAHMRWRETAHTYAAVFERVYARPIGGLPIEERREPSGAWRPRSLVSGPHAVADEVAEEEVDADQEEDDEVF
jgi:hypothetical protein